MRFGQSRRVAFAVWWKQSVEVLQTALEFGLFVLIQRLLLKRLQQRSGGRNEDQYVRSDRHDEIAILFREQTQVAGPPQPITF